MVSGSDFIVSRTANKDNSSSYYLRKPSTSPPKKVQFKEISQLLQSFGIDLRYNRFLILQGEVEQIALMKPKAENENETGMLEFLEDIIGSNRLKEPLAKLQERVDETNEERAEKMNRLKAIQKEKDALEGPRNEAIKFMQLENQIVQEKNKLFQVLRQKDIEKRDSANDLFQEHNLKLQEAMKEIDSLQENKNQLLNDYKEKETAFSKHKTDVESARKKFRELENDDLKLGELVKGTKNKGKNITNELEREEKKLEELQGKPAELEEDIEVLTVKKEQLENDKAVADEELNRVRREIKKDTEELNAEKEEKQQQLLDLQKGVDDAKSAMEIAKSEFQLYVQRQRTEKAKLDQLKFKFDSNEREINAKKTALAKFTGSLPDMEKEVDVYGRQVSKKKSEKDQLEQEVRSLRVKENEAKNKMNNTKSRNKVQSALLDAKRKGRLTGIIGRLGDLGTIPPTYDVAVSTACGRLDQTVVETTEDAMAAITFLKEHSLGVTTFIALDQITAQHEGKWQNWRGCPEDSQRLFDLIVPNQERLKVAFYFSLWDTLVCKDLSQATRISNASGRSRIVTLDGKIIESSGAMTGGGRPSKGRMTLSSRRSSVVGDDDVSEESLKQIQENISTKSGEIVMLNEEISGLQSKIEKLHQEIAQMKESAPKLRLAVKSLEEQQEPIKRHIQETEEACQDATPDPERVKDLDAKLESTTKEHKNREAEAAVFEKEVNEIKEKIRDILEKSLGAAKKKAQQVKSQLDSVNSDLAKKSAAKKNAERNIEKSQQRIEQLKKETEEAITKIKELKEQKKQLEEQAIQLTEMVKEIEALTPGFQEEINGITKKIDVIKQRESKLKTDNLDLKHEVDKLETAVKERDQEVKRWTDKVKTLELQTIPDEDFDPNEEEEYQDEVSEEEQDDGQVCSSESATLNSSRSTVVGDSESEQLIEVPEEGHSVEKVEKKCVKKKIVVKKRRKHSLHVYSKYELVRLDTSRVKAELESLEQELKAMKPNMASIEDFKKKVEVYLSRSEELRITTEKRDMYKSQFESLRNQRMAEFKEGFLVITMKLKEMYRTITAGGDADLEWADSLDPFSEGIIFSVRPNKKSWKKISNLSGGEKTLSSLSLIFALHFYKPSPLYVMDEIDAALDFKNVSIVAQYIKDRTKNTQFIIISLRNNMYELAYRLVGIYKTHNSTKSVVLVPTDFPSDLRQHGKIEDRGKKKVQKGQLLSEVVSSQP